MKERGSSDVGLYQLDVQNADKNSGSLSWPQIGDKIFAKTDERVKDFQMATVIDLKDSDGSIKVRWDSSLDFSWIGRSPKLLQRATPNEKRSRLPVNLYSKGSVRPRRGMISYDERDNDDKISREEMDIEEEVSEENIQQEYSQDFNINDAFSSSAVLRSTAKQGQNFAALSGTNIEHIPLSSSSSNGSHENSGEKVALINGEDRAGSNPASRSVAVTKTEMEELNDSIMAIERKMDSDIRNRLRTELYSQFAAEAASASASSETGARAGSHEVSSGDISSSNIRMVIDNRSSSSTVGQSLDNIVLETTTPPPYPHIKLLRFHSLKEVPNFRCRWADANESTKVRLRIMLSSL